jgi:hypothetical protein
MIGCEAFCNRTSPEVVFGVQGRRHVYCRKIPMRRAHMKAQPAITAQQGEQKEYAGVGEL